MAASTTGLARYLDARSKLLDARQSAIAVRSLLDEALTDLSEEPDAREEGDGARHAG